MSSILELPPTPCPTIAKSHRTFLATLLFLPCNARVYLVTRPSGFARCAGRPKQFVGSLRGVEGGKNTHISSCLPPGEVALFGWLLAGAEAKHQSPCAWLPVQQLVDVYGIQHQPIGVLRVPQPWAATACKSTKRSATDFTRKSPPSAFRSKAAISP